MSMAEDYDEDRDESATCKRCGQEDLTWYNMGSGKHPEWRLFDQVNGRIVAHKCKFNDLFEDLT